MVADGVGELMDEEAKRGTLPSSRSEIIGWMLTSYIRAAMRQARYEIVEDDGSFYPGPSHNPITLLRPANPPCSRCPPSVAGPRFR